MSKFTVIIDDAGILVEASNMEKAAEEGAAIFDSLKAGYPISDKVSYLVSVHDEQGKIKKYKVFTYLTPGYSADEWEEE